VSQRQLIARTATVLAMIAFGWWVTWFVRRTTDVFLLLLISAILAAGLAPLVGLVERWRLPRGGRLSRGVAIFIVYLAMFAAVAAVLAIIVVPAVGETNAFVQNLPQFLAALRHWLADAHRQFPWLPDMAVLLRRLPAQLQGLSRYGPRAAQTAFRVFGGIADSIAILVFTFYMLLEAAQVKTAFLSPFPIEQRARVDEVLRRIGVKFGGWLRAQLLLSVTLAIIVSAGLLALGMPFPFLLGVVAGIGELIPMVGPSIGAAAAILVALFQPFWRLVAVAIFYAIVLNVEPHILVPRIMSRVVGMSPLVTLFALLVGIKLLGILGGLLAVPVAAALQVIASEIVAEIQPREAARPALSAPPEVEPDVEPGAPARR
jgi:predicted PurR-regulated permease PerM